jgi:hypothetical protein
MFASYKKNALIGRVLSADAKTEVWGRREVQDDVGTPGTQSSPLEQRGNAGKEPMSKWTVPTRIDNVSSE